MENEKAYSEMRAYDYENFVLVYNFVQMYKHDLLEEHLKALKNFLNRWSCIMAAGYAKSKYGVHYKCCLWSTDDCVSGPDTCECTDFYIELKNKIFKLMQLYARLKNKKINQKHFN